jgi:hypothetical protein
VKPSAMRPCSPGMWMTSGRHWSKG